MCDKVWQREGSKLSKNSVMYFMDGPFSIVSLSITSLYYLFKVSIVSLSVCYVTAGFSASIFPPSVCYATILFLQGFRYSVICLLRHCSVLGFSCLFVFLLRHCIISSRFPLFLNFYCVVCQNAIHVWGFFHVYSIFSCLVFLSALLFAWFMLPNLLRHWSVLGLSCLLSGLLRH